MDLPDLAEAKNRGLLVLHDALHRCKEFLEVSGFSSDGGMARTFPVDVDERHVLVRLSGELCSITRGVLCSITSHGDGSKRGGAARSRATRQLG